MPEIRNPIVPGHICWQCAYCGKVFPMADLGQEHEANCPLRAAKEEELKELNKGEA